MSFWFSKNKSAPNSSESQLKSLISQVEQQRKENTSLRVEFEGLKESALHNKVMLDEFISNATNYEKTTEQMRLKIQGMENTLRTYESTVRQLR
jgi:regulator of replication initiation timing